MRRNLTPHVCPNAIARLAMLAVCCNGWISQADAAQTKRPDTLDGDNTMPRLTGKLYNYAEVPSGILAKAETETVRILRAAGIELSLVPCPVSDRDFQNAPAKFAACKQAADAPIVRIETPPNILPSPPLDGSVIGAAKEDQVTVSYDQVQQVSGVHDIPRGKLLGHVIAHELGHVLLADHSHSPEGIMIATFRKQELQRTEIGNLLFTTRQAARMRARLREGGLRAGDVRGSDK
jgi:hypothetical protein